MGNETSKEGSQDFLSRLTYVQLADDDNFTGFEVFRSKEPPYEYIMNYQKTFLTKDAAFQNYMQMLRQLREKSHKNIARLHHVQQRQQNHMCIKNIKVSCYLNYYNFTLQNAINKKKQAGSFSQNQLWYVVMCLLEAGRFQKAHGIAFGDYKANNIFLTPQGYVKLYLTGVCPDNKHNVYYSLLSSRQDIEKHLLSPQQLEGLKYSEYEPRFDLFKSDIFSIGMILMEMLFLDDHRFYYSYQTGQLNFGRVKYNLAITKKNYSTQLFELLTMLLEEDPNKRADFETALAHIEKSRKMISVAGSVKLMDDEEESGQKKKPVKKPKEGPVGLRNLPMNIDQRLKVAPISTLTDKRPQLMAKKKSINAHSLQTSAASTGSFSCDRRNSNREPPM